MRFVTFFLIKTYCHTEISDKMKAGAIEKRNLHEDNAKEQWPKCKSVQTHRRMYTDVMTIVLPNFPTMPNKRFETIQFPNLQKVNTGMYNSLYAQMNNGRGIPISVQAIAIHFRFMIFI